MINKLTRLDLAALFEARTIIAENEGGAYDRAVKALTRRFSDRDAHDLVHKIVALF